MKVFQSDRTILLTLGLLFSVNAQAIILSSSDNYTNDAYLSDGSYTGSFDINAQMALMFDTDSYVINSGYIDFSFIDDTSDVYFSTGKRVSSYGSYRSGYRNTYDRIYINPDESVTATTGDQSQTASGTYYSERTFSHSTYSTRRISQGHYRDVSCGWWDLFRSCSEWVDQSYTVRDSSYYYNNESGYAIDANFSLSLDDIALSDLMLDGILDFNLDISGDMLFSNATMTFDVSLRKTSSVPEPTSLALMCLGLVGLGISRRRKVA